MKQSFGRLRSGEEVFLYTITDGGITAVISDYGATLVKLLVPDPAGNVADVVLGFDDPDSYTDSGTFFGAVVGRNANRIGGAAFELGGKTYRLPVNNGTRNNHHSGPDYYKDRIWTVEWAEKDSICLRLESPDGDQGFPGNAEIRVTYSLEGGNTLKIVFDGVSDRDTVFNLTTHSYFNMAGHEHPEKAMGQILCMPARFYNVADAESISTGQLRSVEGTPMDFRVPKAIGRDLDQEYEAFTLQGGYDHNFEVYTVPCAILTDPESGRSMAVSTDCPGIHVYSGNYLGNEAGKDGIRYGDRGGVALEPQFYPDSVNHPEWPQPFTKAGAHYRSQTRLKFN